MTNIPDQSKKRVKINKTINVLMKKIVNNMKMVKSMTKTSHIRFY